MSFIFTPNMNSNTLWITTLPVLREHFGTICYAELSRQHPIRKENTRNWKESKSQHNTNRPLTFGPLFCSIFLGVQENSEKNVLFGSIGRIQSMFGTDFPGYRSMCIYDLIYLAAHYVCNYSTTIPVSGQFSCV